MKAFKTKRRENKLLRTLLMGITSCLLH